MASVISLAMTIFMVVPVLAPSLGQVIILIGALAGDLPAARTLRVADGLVGDKAPARDIARKPAGGRVHLRRIIRRLRHSLPQPPDDGLRASCGHDVSERSSASLMSAQQIFTEIFGLGVYFPLAFGRASRSPCRCPPSSMRGSSGGWARACFSHGAVDDLHHARGRSGAARASGYSRFRAVHDSAGRDAVPDRHGLRQFRPHWLWKTQGKLAGTAFVAVSARPRPSSPP